MVEDMKARNPGTEPITNPATTPATAAMPSPSIQATTVAHRAGQKSGPVTSVQSAPAISLVGGR